MYPTAILASNTSPPTSAATKKHRRPDSRIARNTGCSDAAPCESGISADRHATWHRPVSRQVRLRLEENLQHRSPIAVRHRFKLTAVVLPGQNLIKPPINALANA